MTLSPTLTSIGTRLPLSSTRPGPTARTSPSWGFSLAVSGITKPDAVVCSASTVLTTIRSSSGLMETDTTDLPFACDGNQDKGPSPSNAPPSSRVPDARWAVTGQGPGRDLSGSNLECRLALGQGECSRSL